MSDNSKPHLLSHFPEAQNQNSNISCQTDEDQSISGLNKRSCSFVWKIKNFKDRPEQKEASQYLKMADGGFDPCECIFNHEMAMRRLLSLLRSSQSYCTDNECFQDGLPGPGEGGAAPDNFMMIMIGWMLMAMMMFFLRPNSMRNNTAGKPQGPGGNSQGPRDPPPTVS